ncbi:hydrolase GDSL [Hyphomicrobium nitrativorans NL23]|uniref:Hydrolase GDSL n=1 Tax=Hyphomicrobium nitrativorans NL23 TaxID=1029756 RepID=V5S9M2_9HYPH|nr:arylesterase [Hyphomicrobium nitrativorans]AHB47318.1 hydrolase GDSL [Hyphomicrobium nitrativorans NL23]
MKPKQTASTFTGQMVRAIALVNLWLLAAMTPVGADDARPIRIVAFGDSLTAGYQLKQDQAFPIQLAAALKAKGHAVDVVNAGVSGDTTAAGLARFDWAVPDDTEAVILALGANDALRGIDPDVARHNLDQILTKLRERNIDVLIAGMPPPKNWGKDYEDRFGAMYADLAETHGALLYPFFLDGVALDPKLNLADGMHPTGEGIGIIVEKILPDVEELIRRVEARRGAGSKS